MLQTRCCLLSWILPAVAVLGNCGQACGADAASERFDSDVKPILEARCVECHGADVQEGGLNLSQRDGLLAGGESGPAIVPGSADASLLLQKIRSGVMPPDEPRLSPAGIALLERWIAAGAVAAGEEPADVKRRFAQMHVSEAEIMTNVFFSYCITCHGRSRQEAGLDLRTRESMLRGGRSGPALVPGSPAESLVYQKIVADEMPPKKNIFGDENYVYRVQAGDIDRLKLWIELGALQDEPADPDSGAAPDREAESAELHWGFLPPQRPAVPSLVGSNGDAESGSVKTSIDAFLLQRLQERDLTLSPPAERLVLLRRAHFDLTGLPPSPREVQEWMADDSDDAFERLIDRLLDSSHYGERWARHWLDVAGYSDTHGVIDRDELRRFMWRYRDYVIQSFNDDKPYDQFLTEQIAGDELVDWKSEGPLSASQIDGLVATGFLRTAPDATDEGAYNKIVDRFAVLNEQVDIFSTAVMGITMECSRCHDHKFDPISRQDYYRFSAIFRSALDPYDWRIPNEFLYPPKYVVPHEHQRFMRHESDTLTLAVQRYNDRIDGEIAPLEQQLEAMAVPYRQQVQQEAVTAEDTASPNEITIEELGKRFPEFAQKSSALQQQMSALRSRRFNRMLIHGVNDMGGVPTPVHVLRRGDERAPRERVEAGIPVAIARDLTPFRVVPPEHATGTSGRRLALARWLTQPEHPLTARVIVNRIWQHHFGQPLVVTTGNFGRSGASPTHPELLDWLATEFVRRGWSLKEMHRLIMRSAAWQQSSRVKDDHRQRDPDNVLLSRFPFRRLDAEQIRDALLTVSGQLDTTPFGPADEIRETTSGEILSQPSISGYRRSIYMVQRRLKRQTMLELFDAPAMAPNCLQRPRSTVAPQALQFLNSPFVRECAAHFADEVRRQAGSDQQAQVQHIYLTAFARPPDESEANQGMQALDDLTRLWKEAPTTADSGSSPVDAERQALTVFCHTLLNSPEFMYTD